MNPYDRLTVFFYRLTGGKIGGKFRGAPVLLLTTRGRKSRKLRTTPVLYAIDGENLTIVAANGGRKKDPSWWLNLKHDASAEVRIRRERRQVRAVEALGDERTRVWKVATKMYPRYEKYQQRTSRVIPVAVLKPLK